MGSDDNLNKSLENASRLADFIELGELMALDAMIEKNLVELISEEYQTSEGEPLRNDEKYAYVSAWEYIPDSPSILHKEDLNYEFVEMTQRNYK